MRQLLVPILFFLGLCFLFRGILGFFSYRSKKKKIQQRRIFQESREQMAKNRGEKEVQENLASLIDHTLLVPTATEEEIRSLCREAKIHGFHAVCVHGFWVPFCRDELEGSSVKIAAVVGFPLGMMSTKSKFFEAKDALKSGASEIDMVVNLGAFKSKDFNTVKEDMRTVVEACHPEALVKVILETGYLSEEETRILCEMARSAGADFVKTSTGFGPGRSTPEDVALMRRTVGSSMGVKASGGIRTYREAQTMIASGASRLGTSSGVKIVIEET